MYHTPYTLNPNLNPEPSSLKPTLGETPAVAKMNEFLSMQVQGRGFRVQGPLLSEYERISHSRPEFKARFWPCLEFFAIRNSVEAGPPCSAAIEV